MEYLGHMIYPSGLRIQKAKVETISQVFQLMDVSQLWYFKNLCQYYWTFVKGFNNIAKPLTQFTKITYGAK
jgi:hypothetical protein